MVSCQIRIVKQLLALAAQRTLLLLQALDASYPLLFGLPQFFSYVEFTPLQHVEVH
jgi:hypothetical protein